MLTLLKMKKCRECAITFTAFFAFNIPKKITQAK